MRPQWGGKARRLDYFLMVVLAALSCLDCEGWRKSRLQIIRTNNSCQPVLKVFIIPAISREEIHWSLHLLLHYYRTAGTWLWTCCLSILNFYRDAVKFNFLWQISSQKPSTNIQIFKNYFDKTSSSAKLVFVHFQFSKWLELSKGGQHRKKFC